MTPVDHDVARSERGGRAMRTVVWIAGLLVAIGAAVATAHGLFEVAVAARVPAGIAWIYPLITDGLALVAYAASARLHGPAARYAWGVVVLAAGLSGLAQAMFLAADAPAVPTGVVAGPAFEASAALRFGVGAWPAVAAAIVAHLLYLLATDQSGSGPQATGRVQPEVFSPPSVQPDPDPVQPVGARAVQAGGAVQPSVAAAAPSPALAASPVERPAVRAGGSPARDRARIAAERHAQRHGALPTVTELEAAAEVSRGTAATVLKALRAEPPTPVPLHLITTSSDRNDQDDDPTIEKATQP